MCAIRICLSLLAIPSSWLVSSTVPRGKTYICGFRGVGQVAVVHLAHVDFIYEDDDSVGAVHDGGPQEARHIDEDHVRISDNIISAAVLASDSRSGFS